MRSPPEGHSTSFIAVRGLFDQLASSCRGIKAINRSPGPRIFSAGQAETTPGVRPAVPRAARSPQTSAEIP